MTTISASKAKLHFGALIDEAQKSPVTIAKQGRPVAVMLSFAAYTEHFDAAPSKVEREQALRFLDQWADRPKLTHEENVIGEDPKAQAIWEKFTHTS